MNEFHILTALAYQKETVAARRLAQRTGMTLPVALCQILQQAAGSGSLESLLEARRRQADHCATLLANRRAARAALRAGKAAEARPDPAAWLAWFDGACHPNPGRMQIGGLLRSPAGRSIEISRAIGQGDGNQAECLALIAVLQAALAEDVEQLVVYGDSRVVIDGVGGSGSTRGLAGHDVMARRLLAELGRVQLRWIPRHKNAAADALSQAGLPAPLYREPDSDYSSLHAC